MPMRGFVFKPGVSDPFADALIHLDVQESTITTVPTNLVTQIDDISGNDNHFINNTGTYRPVYSGSGAGPGFLNNIPPIEFPFSSGWGAEATRTTLFSDSTISHGQDVTWLYICAPRNLVATIRRIVSDNLATGFALTTGNASFKTGAFDMHIANAVDEIDVFNVLQNKLFFMRKEGTTLSYWINNEAKKTAVVNNFTATNLTQYLGYNLATSGLGWRHFFGKYVFWDNAKSDADIESMIDTLTPIWDIP